MLRGFCLHIQSALDVVSFGELQHSNRCVEVALCVVLICIFLITNKAELLFPCLFMIYFSFGEVSKSFAHFFFLLDFKFSYYGVSRILYILIHLDASLSCYMICKYFLLVCLSFHYNSTSLYQYLLFWIVLWALSLCNPNSQVFLSHVLLYKF